MKLLILIIAGMFLLSFGCTVSQTIQTKIENRTTNESERRQLPHPIFIENSFTNVTPCPCFMYKDPQTGENKIGCPEISNDMPIYNFPRHRKITAGCEMSE